MPTRQEWLAVVRRIRQTRDHLASPVIGALYDLAVRDGEALLGARYRDLGGDERRDFVHDVLATALLEIITAENPRGLFLVCLKNRVLSHFRKPRETPTEDEALASLKAAATRGGAEEHVEVSEVLALLEQLPARDVQILLAAALGEQDGEGIARVFGMTRASVHQIICRLRKLLRKATGRPR